MTATTVATVPAPTVTIASAPSGHTFALPQKSSVSKQAVAVVRQA